ncbi:MerR family transcriptional regulator [Salinifilum ghardaiensis]
MSTDEPLITTSELARRLGLASRTITDYAQRGWITPALITPGGQYRWRYENAYAEINRLGQRRKQQGSEEDESASS